MKTMTEGDDSDGIMKNSVMKKRICSGVIFLVLLSAEILIGKYGRGFVRGYVGDILVIPCIYYLLRCTFFGRDTVFSVYVLPLLTYFLGWNAEILQAYHIADVLGIAKDSPLRIAIGGVCDLKDILCYLVGLYLIGLIMMAEPPQDGPGKRWYPMAVFLHWTWGYPQTIAGLFIYLYYFGCPHSYYGGVVKTAWPKDSGVSLGMFIFTPREPAPSDSGKEAEDRRRYCDEVTVHEYGHTFQALLLGYLYPVIIGIPSMSWANIPYFRKLRREKNIPYTWLFCEKWASYAGEKVTGKKAIWN